MIGDTVIYEAIHFKKAGLILPKVLKTHMPGNKTVITIGGESGTGKTEVAFIVQKKLYDNYHITSRVIHTDDYYKTYWCERNKIRKKKGIQYVGQDEILWDKFQSVIDSFVNNEDENHIQQIHKYTNSIEYVKLNNKTIDIFIVEGLYSLYLHDHSDLNIYLCGTIKDTEAFRRKRKKEEQNAFRLQVLQKEGKVVRASEKWADVKITFSGKIEA